MEAEESVEELLRKNREYQQKMLKHRQRIEKNLKRQSPAALMLKENNQKKSKPLTLDIDNHRTPRSVSQSLIEPSHDFIQQGTVNNDNSYPKQRSQLQYNSNLFRNLRESDNFQSQNMERTDQFLNNYSSNSAYSKIQQHYDNSSQNNILSKINQVLEYAHRVQNKNQSKLLDEFIERKSISNTSSILSQSNFSDNQDRNTQFIHSGRNNKLRTIEEQRQTLTIQHEQEKLAHRKKKQFKQIQKQEKRKKEENIQQVNKSRSQTNKNLPPLASNTNSTIQRQKKKLQEAMIQIKKIDHSEHDRDAYEKQSIVFDLSDNESDLNENNKDKLPIFDNQPSQQMQQSSKAKEQKQKKRKNFQSQKTQLLQQLQKINARLAFLEQSQIQEQQF